MIIVRRIEIDYGHTLPKHFGFCNQIHGHRGIIECHFEGDINNDFYDSKNGMVMDFSVCKRIMMREIHSVLDHGFAIWNRLDIDHFLVETNEVIEDDNTTIRVSTLDFIRARNEKILQLDDPPTAEILAKYFFKKINNALDGMPDKIKLKELHWWETPNNKAIAKE